MSYTVLWMPFMIDERWIGKINHLNLIEKGRVSKQNRIGLGESVRNG